MKKERLDVLLVERGLFPTREKARSAVMAGLVQVAGERCDKPGTKIAVDAPIEVKGEVHPYVSRGGLKLEKALRVFGVDMGGKVVMDVGASTGGFTDCALKHGARKVYAIDVGYGQLAWSLRQDERVVVMERTNFRHLDPDAFPHERPDVGTVDVSFISLRLILPVLYRFLLDGGDTIALVKPQFEAGKEFVGKNGIVRDPEVHVRVIAELVQFARTIGFGAAGLDYSPIQGGEGNIEFLLHLRKGPDDGEDWSGRIGRVVAEAHRAFRKETDNPLD